MARIRIVAASLLALVLAGRAPAQTMVPPGQMAIDGVPVACGPSPTMLVGPELGDAAKADGQRIWLNWPALQMLPTGAKLFVYAHECGHNLYGPDENVADRFAIRLGVQQGWINPVVLNQICATVIWSPGDWTHLPGGPRCAMMANYYRGL